MIKKSDSLTIVLNGDWNNYYIQPDWIAKNVFEQETIEIGVNGIGTSINVIFKYNNVAVQPTQSQVIFSAFSSDIETLELFSKCVDNFLKKSTTPFLVSYGLNSDFADTGDIFAESIDRMGDNVGLIEHGCEIVSTRVNKTIKLEGNIFNLDCFLNNGIFTMHINEHHEGRFNKESYPIIDTGLINDFFGRCWSIVESLGYEKEE